MHDEGHVGLFAWCLARALASVLFESRDRDPSVKPRACVRCFLVEEMTAYRTRSGALLTVPRLGNTSMNISMNANTPPHISLAAITAQRAWQLARAEIAQIAGTGTLMGTLSKEAEELDFHNRELSRRLIQQAREVCTGCARGVGF